MVKWNHLVSVPPTWRTKAPPRCLVLCLGLRLRGVLPPWPLPPLLLPLQPPLPGVHRHLLLLPPPPPWLPLLPHLLQPLLPPWPLFLLPLQLATGCRPLRSER